MNKREQNQNQESFALDAVTLPLNIMIRDIALKLNDQNYVPDLQTLKATMCRWAYEHRLEAESFDFEGAEDEDYRRPELPQIPWTTIGGYSENIKIPPTYVQYGELSSAESVFGETVYKGEWVLKPGESAIFPQGLELKHMYEAEEFLNTGLWIIIAEMLKRCPGDELIDFYEWLFIHAESVLVRAFADDNIFVHRELIPSTLRSLNIEQVANLDKLLMKLTPHLRYPQARELAKHIASDLQAHFLDLLITRVIASAMEFEYEYANDGQFEKKYENYDFLAFILRGLARDLDKFTLPEIKTVLGETLRMVGFRIPFLLNTVRHMIEEVDQLESESRDFPTEKANLEKLGKLLLWGDMNYPKKFHTRLGGVYRDTNFDLYPNSEAIREFRATILDTIVANLGLKPTAQIFSIAAGTFWTEEDLIRLGYPVFGLEPSEDNIDYATKRMEQMRQDLADDAKIDRLLHKGTWDELDKWPQLITSRQNPDSTRVFTVTGRSWSHVELWEVFDDILSHLYEQMLPGDVLIFDLPDPNSGMYAERSHDMRRLLQLFGATDEEITDADFIVDGPDLDNEYNRFAPPDYKIVARMQKLGFEHINPRAAGLIDPSLFPEFITEAGDLCIREKVPGLGEDQNRNMLFVFRKPRLNEMEQNARVQTMISKNKPVF